MSGYEIYSLVALHGLQDQSKLNVMNLHAVEGPELSFILSLILCIALLGESPDPFLYFFSQFAHVALKHVLELFYKGSAPA